jgi:antitoxin component of MazEF toxin-antitoxin module
VERKLFKTGNSLTVTIPPSVAAQLRFTAGAMVELEIDREHDGLLVRLRAEADPRELTPEFAEWVDGFVDRYEDSLRQLAGGTGEAPHPD